MSKENKRNNAGRTSKKKNQHTLEHKVKCNKCGKEFYPKIKELAILKGCIIVSGFTCKCGAEYVTTVTDNELRRDLCRLQDLQDEYKREQKKIDNEIKEIIRLKGRVPEDIQERLNIRANKYLTEIGELKAKTTKRGQWLKAQYKAKYPH